MKKIENLNFRKIFVTFFAALLVFGASSGAYIAATNYSHWTAARDFERLST